MVVEGGSEFVQCPFFPHYYLLEHRATVLGLGLIPMRGICVLYSANDRSLTIPRRTCFCLSITLRLYF